VSPRRAQLTSLPPPVRERVDGLLAAWVRAHAQADAGRVHEVEAALVRLGVRIGWRTTP
jgi:hypothetical protein